MANSTHQDHVKFENDSNSKFANVIIKIIKILEIFNNNYEKRLNFTKLAHYLKLNAVEVDEILKLILIFQDLFNKTFNNYKIEKRIIDNQLFLIAEAKPQTNLVPKKIKLSAEDFNLLSDITYLFKNVKRGKGFNVNANGTELLSSIKEFWDYHPYFFEKNENGLIYPSEFGLKLGELILSYKKSGKAITHIELEGKKIMME